MSQVGKEERLTRRGQRAQAWRHICGNAPGDSTVLAEWSPVEGDGHGSYQDDFLSTTAWEDLQLGWFLVPNITEACMWLITRSWAVVSAIKAVCVGGGGYLFVTGWWWGD